MERQQFRTTKYNTIWKANRPIVQYNTAKHRYRHASQNTEGP